MGIMSINISSKILITGGSGMVGKNMKDIITNNNYGYEWIFLSSKNCNLTNSEDVDILFNKIKPTYVIHLAACVGGLFKHMREKTKMFKDNILINENVLSACNKYNVEKGIF